MHDDDKLNTRARGRTAAHGRRARRPQRPLRRAAPGPGPGGSRADHRHDRRDRRPLRRQPRHLRAGRGAAQHARLAQGQDPLGRRPPGLSAQDPDRTPPRPRQHPPVRGAGAVLLGVRVRARHHGRRPRLDLDRLRRRAQGGDAEGHRRGRQGRRRDRRRRAHRRRRLRGAAPRRRAADADRDRAQRQRHVDLAQRRRHLPLLQPRAAEPALVRDPLEDRGAADQPSARPWAHVRATRARGQGRDQGLLGAGPVLRGARPRLRRRDRRARRRFPAPRADRGVRGQPPGRRPHPHGQGQGLRARRGGRPGGDGEVARRQAGQHRQRQGRPEEA